MIVISDTGPLHYLTMISELDILPALFGRVIIPRSVIATELADSATPKIVWSTLTNPPPWLIALTDPPVAEKSLLALGLGERHALSLMLEMRGDLLLCDDLAARNKASALGLSVMGTLGLIDEAGYRNLLNFDAAIDRLLHETNFHHTPASIDSVRARHRKRMQGREEST